MFHLCLTWTGKYLILKVVVSDGLIIWRTWDEDGSRSFNWPWNIQQICFQCELLRSTCGVVTVHKAFEVIIIVRNCSHFFLMSGLVINFEGFDLCIDFVHYWHHFWIYLRVWPFHHFLIKLWANLYLKYRINFLKWIWNLFLNCLTALILTSNESQFCIKLFTKLIIDFI